MGTLRRPRVRRYRTLTVLLALACAGALVVASPPRAAAGDRVRGEDADRAPHPREPWREDAHGRQAPEIRWSPGRVAETVVRGGTTTALVSFSSTGDLTDVSVAIGRELAPYVSASPSSFASIAAGTTTTVTLTFSASAHARLGTRHGALHVRGTGRWKRRYARPLPVRVRVAPDHPPVADAGPDQASGVVVGDAVALDGSASSDPDGQPLTYAWSLVAAPAGSAAELSDPTAARTGFVADTVGTYVARLTVNDGVLESAPDDVSITVVVPPPTVTIAAPENLSVVAASPVTLTGTVDDPSAALAVNGTPVANDNGTFTVAVALVEGSNTITVVGENGTGQGSASVEVILNAVGAPAIAITSPVRGFVAGEAFAMGAPFHATQVAVAGVIKVNTTAPFPIASLNQPTVTVNGVPADVSLNLFSGGCRLLNPFQCWRFTATVPLERGQRTITAVGTDVALRSATATVQGTVDYCRIGDYDSQASTPGKDPGVTALAGISHDIQSNRCHEIDGCSAPLTPQQCADDPMTCPLGGGGTVVHDPFLPIPARSNVASTAFGKGGDPPTGFGNPPGEYFVHGQESRFALACNHHDACYQTCVRVTGLSDAEREQAWEDAWHACNQRQYREMLDTCTDAYPARCPYTIFGLPDPVACVRWLEEKVTCSELAFVYLKFGVETTTNPIGVSGLERFKQRQADYCAE